jgi:hypothetical protein
VNFREKIQRVAVLTQRHPNSIPVIVAAYLHSPLGRSGGYAVQGVSSKPKYNRGRLKFHEGTKQQYRALFVNALWAYGDASKKLLHLSTGDCS